MASFDNVNYSLRPSKSIQRQIVFDGVRALHTTLAFQRMVYIGFGSIWFTDFIMAHKALHIADMISIEKDDIGHRRAEFNAPYATVRVLHGSSADILPGLYHENAIRRRPWILWLDYDTSFNEDLRDDVRSVIEGAPSNTIFLVTMDGKENLYGAKPRKRPQRLRQLLGDVVSDDLPKHACKPPHFQNTLADLTLNFMQALAAECARPERFVPAFRLVYKDTATMVTVGGVLTSRSNADAATALVRSPHWRCWPDDWIRAPHLTVREALALQARLPAEGPLTRESVRSLGFDLDEGQIEAFQKYYREYPAYAQIVGWSG